MAGSQRRGCFQRWLGWRALQKKAKLEGALLLKVVELEGASKVAGLESAHKDGWIRKVVLVLLKVAGLEGASKSGHI